VINLHLDLHEERKKPDLKFQFFFESYMATVATREAVWCTFKKEGTGDSRRYP